MSRTLRRAWLPGLALLSAAIGVAWPEPPVQVGPGAAGVLLFDVTQSMNVADMNVEGKPVSRIVFARAAARQAVNELPCGTALGVGILAAHRALLLVAPVEVCQYRHELVQAIDFIGPAMAWQGNSEIAKGYYAGLRIMADLPGKPALVLLSDGHEAPPISPLHRPAWDASDNPARALVAGIGGATAAPIPKTDPEGRSLGFWGPDDVMQIDGYSTGRGGSNEGERYVESEAGKPIESRALGTPGTEHLSALREPYLQLLAEETSARYVRLTRPDDLRIALTRTLIMPGWFESNARRFAAAIALLLLAAYYVSLWPGLVTWRVAPRK